MRIQVSKEGARVLLAIRDDAGSSVTLDLHHMGGGTLAAAVRDASDSADDCEREFELRGSFTVAKKEG